MRGEKQCLLRSVGGSRSLPPSLPPLLPPLLPCRSLPEEEEEEEEEEEGRSAGGSMSWERYLS